jgi:hypothetical protein
MSYEQELSDAKQELWQASETFLINKMKKNRKIAACVMVGAKQYGASERERQLYLVALSKLVSENLLVRQTKDESEEVYARSQKIAA